MEYDLPPGVIINLTDMLGGGFFSATLIDSDQVAIPYNEIIAYGLWMNVYYNNVGGDPTIGPLFSLTPVSLNYGEVAFGETKTLQTFVTNMGYSDSLYIYNAVSSNPAFSIEPNSFPLILPAGQTQIFNVTYSGIFGGTHNDSILFLHNAPGSPRKLSVYATTYEPSQECVAQILYNIKITDNVDPTVRNLKFGLDSSATDELDPQLGELPTPFFPAAGTLRLNFFFRKIIISGLSDPIAISGFLYSLIPVRKNGGLYIKPDLEMI
ncbi:MAG: hypothetical protein MZV64_01915 [Ignavibacteriales bacterium]|nr:hypothetical protein [Ignavibacteriales bacterium]